MVAAAHVRHVATVVVVLMLVEARDLDAADVPVIRVDVLVVQVADDRIRNPGLDTLDEIVLVDYAVHAVLPEGNV